MENTNPIKSQVEPRRLMRNAPAAKMPTTLYSSGVIRALRIALALDDSTKELHLIFKHGNRIDSNVMLEDSVLYIHERCLYFDSGHATDICRLAAISTKCGIDIKGFWCYHIVMDLYGLLLNEMRAQRRDIAKNYDALYSKVLDALSNMPQGIEIKKGNTIGELTVSWTDCASDFTYRLHGLHSKVRIILHRESTCSKKKSELLAISGMSQDSRVHDGEGHLTELEDPAEARKRIRIADCGCPELIAWPPNFRVGFYELDVSEKFFPMISRIDSIAVFGMPPGSLQPNGYDESDSNNDKQISLSGRPRPSYRKFFSEEEETIQSLCTELYASENNIGGLRKSFDIEVEVETLRKQLGGKTKQIQELEAAVKNLENYRAREPEVETAKDEKIDNLQLTIEKLRDSRRKLKAELTEARQDTREAHAATAEALRLIKSLRESGSLGSGVSGKSSRAHMKRENISGAEDRASKRMKEEPIDVSD